MVKRNGTPSERLHILHRMIEQIVVLHAGWKERNGKVPLLPVDGAVNESNPAVSYELFQNCKRFVHTAPRSVYSSLVYNAA